MKFFLTIVLVVCGFVVQSASVAQTKTRETDAFVRENNIKRAQNPEEVAFTIRFKDDQKQFQQGEVMRLELSFSSSKPNSFVLDTGTYDRSGRIDSDEFVLDQPEAVVDPLYDYFHSSPYGFIGGGLRGIPELADKPEIVNADLNEWMRFDKPGRYRLYVISGRVARKRNPPEAPSSVVSNIVEFEILPADKKWANQQLTQTVTALSKRDRNTRAYCRILRFLGTRTAVSEMIERSRGENRSCDFEFSFGLIGSAHRDFVIQQLEKALSVPDQPVTSSLIRTLVLLDFTSQTPPLPPYPEGNQEQIRRWQAQAERRRSLYNERLSNYLRQLLVAIPQKSELARATSIQTVLEYRSEVWINDWSTVIDLMPEVFNRLPLDSQRNLLMSEWKALAGPSMLPVLRGILKRPENNGYQEKDLRTIALQRLYESSPEEGRRLILDEIRRPQPDVSVTVLRSLPDEILPELDGALVEKLIQRNGDADVTANLIARYATDAISQQVRSFYEAPGAGKWSCAIQASLIAYFLRVDPASGSDYLKQALAARGKNLSRCYTFTLLDVARLQPSREVEDVAIAALNDDDPEVVDTAAQVLKDYGSADAEKALWRRFEKWHEAMQDRSEELRKQNAGVPAFGAPELAGQVTIEHQLRNALIHGRAWLADSEKLKRIRELCFSDASRKEVEALIRDWNQEITIGLNGDGEPVSVGVSHYNFSSIDSLKQKLVQFPGGTVFNWTVLSGNNDAKAQEIFQQIKTYLQDHGMKLKPETAPKADQ